MAIPYNTWANVFKWQRHRYIHLTNDNNLRDLSHYLQMDMKYDIYCVEVLRSITDMSTVIAE
jgi:hypothetical protein